MEIHKQDRRKRFVCTHSMWPVKTIMNESVAKYCCWWKQIWFVSQGLTNPISIKSRPKVLDCFDSNWNRNGEPTTSTSLFSRIFTSAFRTCYKNYKLLQVSSSYGLLSQIHISNYITWAGTSNHNKKGFLRSKFEWIPNGMNERNANGLTMNNLFYSPSIEQTITISWSAFMGEKMNRANRRLSKTEWTVHYYCNQTKHGQ